MKQKHFLLLGTVLALLLSFGSARPLLAQNTMVIATDATWDVSAGQVSFGEYPLSAQQLAAANTAMPPGQHHAVEAAYNPLSKLVPGSTPIWRNRTDHGEGEAYHFRKTVRLGPNPIRKATLEINCDDVARVYINQRLASAENRDGKLKDGYDVWFTLRSLSGFTYNRTYTYDVTDYFFGNVDNTIFIEAFSLAFDGSHAYVSAKIVLEFDPVPAPPVAAKTKAPTKAKPLPPPAPKPETALAPTPKKRIFDAGSDPDMTDLKVGSILELGHVFFKADDYRLDTASYRTLNALTALMKRHPSLKIEIGGHTNLRPSAAFADKLSTQRARTVVQYLTDNGIAADRLQYKGYGKSRPSVNAVSAEADRANQRVEVRVLEE